MNHCSPVIERLGRSTTQSGALLRSRLLSSIPVRSVILIDEINGLFSRSLVEFERDANQQKTRKAP